VKGAGLQLEIEQPRRVDGSWQQQLARRNLAKSDPAVIRLIPDQNDKCVSEVPRIGNPAAHQGATEAQPLQVRRNRQRTQQQGLDTRLANPQVPEAVGTDQTSGWVTRDLAKSGHGAFAFAQAVCRLGPSCQAETSIEQVFDFRGIIGGLRDNGKLNGLHGTGVGNRAKRTFAPLTSRLVADADDGLAARRFRRAAEPRPIVAVDTADVVLPWPFRRPSQGVLLPCIAPAVQPLGHRLARNFGPHRRSMRPERQLTEETAQFCWVSSITCSSWG
jgi:hypothetical protein